MTHLEVFSEYLSQIKDTQHCARVTEVLSWVGAEFPDLEGRIAWKQPMFTDHGTFIIGFSVSGKHMSVSPEKAGMEYFSGEIAKWGYGQSKMLFRIKWEDSIPYSLLERIIRYNCLEKQDCKTFWRS